MPYRQPSSACQASRSGGRAHPCGALSRAYSPPPPAIPFKERRLCPQPTELPRRPPRQLRMPPCRATRFLVGQSFPSRTYSFSNRQKATSPPIWCLVAQRKRGSGKDFIFTMEGKNILTISEARVQLSTQLKQEVPVRAHCGRVLVLGLGGASLLWRPGIIKDGA